MDVRQAAERCGVSTGFLNRLRCRGAEGPAYFRVGSRIYYRAEDLDDWLMRCRVPARAASREVAAA